MNARRFATLLAVTTSLTAYSAYAASFEITNGQTVTSTQVLGAGETGTVDQGGTISVTTGDGIDGFGNNITETNNGIVISTDPAGFGMIIEGNNGMMTNNGSITAEGLSMGVAFGNNGTLINNGTLSGSTAADYGMDIDSGPNTGILAINNGAITLTGTGSYGMFDVDTSSSNNTLVNNGTINVTNSSNGMASLASGDTLINNGYINSGSNGMKTNNINNTIINNGTITVNEDNGDGFSISGNGSLSINNGTIHVTGQDTTAMLQAGGGVYTMINNGTLIAAGTNADGMVGHAASNDMINYGAIVATGTNSDAMVPEDNNIVTNYGTLSTTGTGNAVHGAGNDIIVNNYGRITSNGNNAVFFSGTGGTLHMGANSIVDGTVNYGGGSGVLQYDLSNSGRGGSIAAITGAISGAHTTSIINAGNLTKGARIIQSGNNVAVVTPDQISSTSQTVTQTLDYTGDIINSRFETAMLGGGMDYDGGTQYAAASINDASPASGFAVRDHKMAWTEAFGTYQERPQDGDTDYSKGKAGGVLAGVDLPKNDNGIRSGLYVGGVTGTLDIGKSTFRTIDSNGALAGGYLGRAYGHYFVSGQLAGGWLHNGSSRFTGVDTAAADYDSIFLSPSVTVMRSISGSNSTWVPQATLRYTSQWDNSYNETGSVQNEHVGSHQTNIIEARALMEAHFNQQQERDGVFQPSLRAGIQYQAFLGSRSVDVSTFGTNINFDPSGGNNMVDGVIGATLAYHLNNGPELYADGEGDIGLNKGGPTDNIGITGRLGARWKF